MTFGMVRTGTDNQPVSGITKGTFCVWDPGASYDDWSPVISPKSHLDKIAFHSGLDYIGVKTTLTKTQSFGASNYGIAGTITQVTIGAHGLGYKPMILGQVSLNGSTWYTVNGTTLVNRATNYTIGILGRSILFLADATNIYAVVFQSGQLAAQTLYFRVRVLERSFFAAKPDNGYAFYRDANHVEAAGGRFDTRNRYLQAPIAGQAADIRHFGGQTMDFSTGPNAEQKNLGFCTDYRKENVTAAISAQTAPASPLIVNFSPTEFVFNALGTAPGLYKYQNGRLQVGDTDGTIVFDSARETLSFVDEFKTTITVPARNPVGTIGAGDSQNPQEVIHYSQPVTSGASILFGWAQLTAADTTILVNKPIEFSGSLVVSSTFAFDTYLHQNSISVLSARIQGGYMQVVESYYNFNVTGYSNPPIPSYTVQCQLFACALTGGL